MILLMDHEQPLVKSCVATNVARLSDKISVLSLHSSNSAMPLPLSPPSLLPLFLLACLPLLTSQDPFHKAPTQYSARIVDEQFSRTSVEAPPDAIPDDSEARSSSSAASAIERFAAQFRSYSAIPQRQKPTFYRGSVEFSPVDVSATARNNQPRHQEVLTYYGAASGAPRPLPHPLVSTRSSFG